MGFVWQKHAEWIFRQHLENQKELRAIVESATIHGRDENIVLGGEGISDPTLSAVQGLASNPRYAELNRQISAVERALLMNDGDKAELIKRVYVYDRCTLEGGAVYYGISQSTAKRWKKAVFRDFAKEMGWL